MTTIEELWAMARMTAAKFHKAQQFDQDIQRLLLQVMSGSLTIDELVDVVDSVEDWARFFSEFGPSKDRVLFKQLLAALLPERERVRKLGRKLLVRDYPEVAAKLGLKE